jgi:hypothetical protein
MPNLLQKEVKNVEHKLTKGKINNQMFTDTFSQNLLKIERNIQLTATTNPRGKSVYH